jgi:hypothetical protein
VPRNCGTYNNTLVCWHKFTGCEFTCDFCCGTPAGHAACEGCTEAECKPVPPLLPKPVPPPQTYACYNGGLANWICVPDSTSSATKTQCREVCAPQGL